MKLKYYLRGVGIGIIITTIIFSASISIHKNDIESQNAKEPASAQTVAEASSEQKAEAKATETEQKETETEQKEPETEKKEPNTEKKEPETEQKEPNTEKKEPEAEQKPQPEPEKKEPETVKITVGRGDYSDVVCRRLQEAGLIDDAAAFNKYLIEKDYDNLILPGEYEIAKGSAYEEIAKQLLKK